MEGLLVSLLAWVIIARNLNFFNAFLRTHLGWLTFLNCAPTTRVQHLLLILVKIFLNIVSPKALDPVIMKVALLELPVLSHESLRLLFIL